MARNAEKAQAMLNRWWSMKRKMRVEDTREMERPRYASEVSSIQTCEKWRIQLLQDISKKISEVQNAGLGEFRIRQVNDEINKLIKCKKHWEDRIRELGGTDYTFQNVKAYDSQGLEIAGNGGYKYFGAARDLPGVRELFKKELPPVPKKTQAEIYKDIKCGYYGTNNTEEEEFLYEQQMHEQAMKEWVLKNQNAIDEYRLNNNIQQVDQKMIKKLIDIDYKVKEQDEVEAMYKTIDLRKSSQIQQDDAKLLAKKKAKLLQEYFDVETEMEIEKNVPQYINVAETKQSFQQDY